MPTPAGSASENSDELPDLAGTSAVLTQQSELALLDAGEGYALLFADHAPKDLDLLGFDVLGQKAGQRLSESLSTALGAGNLAAAISSSSTAVVEAQGLVRIAPESMQLLNQLGNSFMQSSGQNLGAIINANGTIVGQARFLPVSFAQGASSGSALLGPAMVLLALQMQLASISRRIDENIELTQSVLRAIHQDQWAALLGLHETSLRALSEAEAAGTVTDHIFAPLASREADLRKYRKLFIDFVREHLKAFDNDPKVSRSYIQKNFDQIIADTHGMLMAELAWYRAQVLRGILISHDDEKLDANERLLTHLVEETKSEHEQAMQEISTLLDEVDRQVRLLSLLPTARSLPFTSKRRSIDEAVAMSEALASCIADLRNQVRPDRAPAVPEISAFKSDLPDKLTSILTYSLPENSQVLALADANQEKLLTNNIFLGFTTDSFFVADQGELLKEGTVFQITPLADIRYVRFAERPKKGPSLEVITKDENLIFTFDAWATDGEGFEAARRIANLFASAMNLPADEQRTDPLIEKFLRNKSTLKEVEA